VFAYNCNIPDLTVLVTGSALTESASIDIAATGGADIPALSATGLSPLGVQAKAPFDLYQIDPSDAVVVEWEKSGAQMPSLVGIDMVGYLASESEFAQVTCSAVGVTGSRTIPADALAAMPTPTADDPLIIKTTIIGATVGGSVETWGKLTVVAGKGEFGVTCRTPAGFCP
jgi:hypothetical protein